MADDEKEFIRIAKNLNLNGQNAQAVQTLQNGLNAYPESVAMKDLLQQYEDAIVTVTCTKEDVVNCILKAKRALDSGNYDRAESLLLRAESISPTNYAKDLLIQVQAVKESNQNSNLIQKTTKAVVVNTVREEESTIISQQARAVKESNQNCDPIQKAIKALDQVNAVKEESTIISQQVQAAKKIKPNTKLTEEVTEAEEKVKTVKGEKSTIIRHQVQSVKESNQNSDLIQKTTKAVEQVTAVKEEESTIISQQVRAAKKIKPNTEITGRDMEKLSLNENAINNKTSALEIKKSAEPYPSDRNNKTLVVIKETKKNDKGLCAKCCIL